MSMKEIRELVDSTLRAGKSVMLPSTHKMISDCMNKMMNLIDGKDSIIQAQFEQIDKLTNMLSHHQRVVANLSDQISRYQKLVMDLETKLKDGE